MDKKPDIVESCEKIDSDKCKEKAGLLNFSHFMDADEAAKFLGLSREQLMYWGRRNSVKAYRHPISQERLYRKEDFLELLERLNAGIPEKARSRPVGKPKGVYKGTGGRKKKIKIEAGKNNESV